MHSPSLAGYRNQREPDSVRLGALLFIIYAYMFCPGITSAERAPERPANVFHRMEMKPQMHSLLAQKGLATSRHLDMILNIVKRAYELV